MEVDHIVQNENNLNEEQFIVKKLNQSSMMKSTLQTYGKMYQLNLKCKK